ncbi:MAG TPA: anhydro-N-acetylmuramic acid kinase [Capsulimonadaceae bacterium]|nr:anhydro-N-acetylmuramic acid kinase [Capsulimonadaceae bacterium]
MALYAGIMSGTSLDGIDVAFAEIDVLDPSPEAPKFCVKPVGAYFMPYSRSIKWGLQQLRNRLPFPVGIGELTSPPGAPELPTLKTMKQLRTVLLKTRPPIESVSRLHYSLSALYNLAFLLAQKEHKIFRRDITAIGLHGQTVWHAPPSSKQGGIPHTLQLGNPAALAERARVAVVSDFRAADIAAGGEGAPLIPFADYVLLSSPTEIRAVLNIGGIANVTFLPDGGQLRDTRAFDTGPGNMVIDAVVSTLTEGKMAYDKDGELAASGTPKEAVLEKLLAHPYFHKAPPKSTGAELFGQAYAKEFLKLCKKLTIEDTVATATALTARSIAAGFRRFVPGRPERLILGGGGAHNATLIRSLAALMPETAICEHSEFGLDGDSKEALAFAILAAAHIHRIPANIPAVTGAAGPRVLGSYTPAP